jgi:hypothetical protein
MQITVNIPDEFAARVEAGGQSPESFVQRLIEDAARTAPAAGAPVRPMNRMNMETFLRKMSAFSEKIPQLPDEAYTRESFYPDHD